MTTIYGESQFNYYVGSSGKEQAGSITVTGGGALVFPVIFTQYALSKRDRIQVVESFSEAVHIYAFGKGADKLVLSGHLLANTNGSDGINAYSSLVSQYDSSLRAFKAAETGDHIVVAGANGIVFSGVVDALDFTMDSSQNNISSFRLSMTSSDAAFYVGGSSSGGSSSSRSG